MIEFISLSQESPYLLFQKKYEEALSAGQKSIQAIAISSYNNESNEVDSRFVNLKFINEREFIFFSNYNSPKSIAFESHNQIAALFYWPSINVQIRLKAKINKTSITYNNEYFKNRSLDKNAIAISSDQSRLIDSYENVIKNYKKSLESGKLKKCPDFWGGYSFAPYYFEFWEGHNSRLNKRDVYKKVGNTWNHSVIQP